MAITTFYKMGDFLHFFAICILYLHFVFCIFVFSYFRIFVFFPFFIFRFSDFQDFLGTTARTQERLILTGRVASDQANRHHHHQKSILTMAMVLVSVPTAEVGPKVY